MRVILREYHLKLGLNSLDMYRRHPGTWEFVENSICHPEFASTAVNTMEPRSTDTLILRTVLFDLMKSSYISLKNNPLITDTR